VTVTEFTIVFNMDRFDIPQPTRNECTIRIKSSPHGVFWFEQHDFHLSYAPFLRALPPELQMSRAAVEVNRYGPLLNPTVLCFVDRPCLWFQCSVTVPVYCSHHFRMKSSGCTACSRMHCL
jgi:hypothetical protein